MRLLLDTHALLWALSQALVEDLVLVTSDRILARYPARTVRA
jgi:PIN domain nuclease of toxin-antitoxin system